MASLVQRFYSKTREAESGCLIWIGAKNGRDGYGNFHLDGKSVRAYRVAWLLERGEIPPGLSVLHRCDNPACVNVEHLFLGTQADNVADCVRKGRKQLKLTPDQVREVRTSTEGVCAMARRFGVSHSLISNIRSGKVGRHVVG